MGVDAMHFLGFRKYAAKRAARTFFEYDEKNLKYLSSLKLNSSEYISTAKKYIEELESLIQSGEVQILEEQESNIKNYINRRKK